MAKIRALNGIKEAGGSTQFQMGTVAITGTLKSINLGFTPRVVYVAQCRTGGTSFVIWRDMDLGTGYSQHSSQTYTFKENSTGNIDLSIVDNGFSIRNNTGQSSWNQTVAYCAYDYSAVSCIEQGFHL